MNLSVLKTTGKWKRYWQNRKIDWNEHYGNWEHPHRFVISSILKNLDWLSLMEIGVGGGANMENIVKTIGGKQIGGVDISKDAIDFLNNKFKGGLFKVGSVEDIMMSDDSTDVVLSDMCLIYIGPRKIKKSLQEIKRIARKYVVLCEFHSESWWNRLALKINTGYNAYNYKKLLKNEGFYDILTYKLTEKDWPGGNPQKVFGYIIVAKVLKIK